MELTSDMTVISCKTKQGFKDMYEAIKKDLPKNTQCIIGNKLFDKEHTEIATPIAIALHQLTYGDHVSFVELSSTKTEKEFTEVKANIAKTIKGTKTKVVMFTTLKYYLEQNFHAVYYDK
jgi:hypothetical protein